MIWFFRYCYFGVYEFNKRQGWERPDEKAFVWMACSRGLMYVILLIIFTKHYNIVNMQINRFWGSIILTAIELFISTMINGRKKHPLIEERFHQLPAIIQTIYTCIGLSLFPILIIGLFILIYIYK